MNGFSPIQFLFVVPTRNSYRQLGSLVSSLQGQAYKHWNVIFVDASDDPAHVHYLESLCHEDDRFMHIPQSPVSRGIFGAMNDGLRYFYDAKTNFDWVVFWGSDDWAASTTVLAELSDVLESAESNNRVPDLLVCRGRYADAASGSLLRATAFQPAGWLDVAAYRRALLLGSTPPHQATLFGPGALQCLSSYSPEFRLSADLDYFLQLSSHPALRVQCLDLELVHMADGGVSGQQTQRRFREVRRAYRRAFGWYWCLPFLLRYVRRVSSLMVLLR